jgi:hypothetical protein
MTALGISSGWREQVSKAKRKTQRRPTSVAAAAPEARRSEGGSGSGSGSSEFKPDYKYVVKDLKRIGLLAGSLILGLIILSFFLK